MKRLVPFFLFFLMVSPDCGASDCAAPDKGEEEKVTIFQPGPCLEMLAEKFKKPHLCCTLMLSSLSFREIAQVDRSEYGGEKKGMRWGWKLHPGDEIPTWYAVSCGDIEGVPRLQYVLSIYHLRDFYQAYKQLEDDSDMQKLWYMLFGK